jgi:hypothetical protein
MEAERYDGTVVRTLCHRTETGNFKTTDLRPQVSLGQTNEIKLVKYIQQLEAAGFLPNKQTAKHAAYQLPQMLSVSHRFPHEQEMVGYAWLGLARSFNEIRKFPFDRPERLL